VWFRLLGGGGGVQDKKDKDKEKDPPPAPKRDVRFDRALLLLQVPTHPP
jgi:hypothetical protein